MTTAAVKWGLPEPGKGTLWSRPRMDPPTLGPDRG